MNHVLMRYHRLWETLVWIAENKDFDIKIRLQQVGICFLGSMKNYLMKHFNQKTYTLIKNNIINMKIRQY